MRTFVPGIVIVAAVPDSPAVPAVPDVPDVLVVMLLVVISLSRHKSVAEIKQNPRLIPRSGHPRLNPRAHG